MKHIRTLIGSAALLTALGAHAVEYTQVQPEKSALQFSYQQMGVKMDGRFKTFNAQLAFDPARPTAAKASFDVELASVDTGASEGDQEVAGKPWFNTKAFPQATFESTSAKGTGPGKFEVAGKLVIKGEAKPLVVPVTLTQAGGVTTATGSFALKRLDFKVGEGDWADTSIVANDVQVQFKLALQGIPAL